MRRGLLILLLLVSSFVPALAQNYPVPFVNQPLVPSAVAPGGPDFTLTVNGTGFVNGATVNWNGTPLATTFVSSSKLTATVPAANTAFGGTVSVTVVNPTPGGGTSNISFFSVSAPGGTGVYAPFVFVNQTTAAMVAADFNNDGKLDLATVTYTNGSGASTSSLYIRLGRGDGTFGPFISYVVQSSAVTSIVAADFNGDGIPDLALADYLTGPGGANPGNLVSILIGNGDGTFQPQVEYPAGELPYWLVAADFNGDGKLDLVTSGAVLLGNGDGTFQAPISSIALGAATFVAGDFNGDGKLDLAFGSGVILGNGDGTFQAPIGHDGVGNLVTGDFNGDGKLDLVGVNGNGFGGNTISLLLGNGDGTFQPAAISSVAYLIPTYIFAGDFNADGNLDVAVVATGQQDTVAGGLSVRYGNGAGTLAGGFDNLISLPGQVIAGDFNGDGLADLVVGGQINQGGGRLYIQTPKLALLPASPYFGDQPVGFTGPTTALKLTNIFSSALSITGVQISGTNPGDFAQTNNCPTAPTTLAAGASCTINATFTPTATGSRMAALTVSDDGPGGGQSAGLSGTGINPAVSLLPASLNFGSQNVLTSSAAQAVTLTNSGVGPLSISTISASANYAQTNNCGLRVAQGASCTINVTFTPTTGGLLNGSVTITDNAADNPQTINLSGTGVPPSVTLSKTSLDFGNQPVSVASTAQTVTVTNNGPGPLLVTGVTLGGTNPGDFAQSGNCMGTITFPGSCTISIIFTPQAGGLRSAVISIADDAVQSPQTISVSGTGVLPTVTQSTTSLTFAGQKVGTTSAAQSVTISNTGAGPLTVSSVVISGANAADFAESDNCKPTVAASGNCTVSVTFSPKANGARTATLTVNDNAASGPQTVTLTGTGQAPLASYSPASLTFTNASVGTPTAPLTVTLTNTGGDALSVTNILVSASFAQTNNCPVLPATLAPSATCSINITFTAVAAGTTFGALIASDNALGSAQQTVPLTGIASVSFADQNVGTTSAAQLVTVMNGGTSSVTVASVTASGDFAAAGACGTLVPGGSCAVNVTFTPTQPGTRTGALVVAGSLPGGSQSVPLVGTGVGAAAKLSVASVSFASQLVDTSSAGQTVTLTNTGNATMTITGIGITGTNAGDFASSYSCGATLAAGVDCTISVTFKPTATGARAATLTISDNAADTPQSVPLSGTGADFAVTAAQGSSTSATVAPGQTASYTLSFAPQGGLSGTVTVTCTGAPSESTCVVNPSTFALSGTNSVNPTVTVTTTAPSLVPPRMRPSPPQGPEARRLVPLILFLLLAGILLRSRARASSPESQAPRIRLSIPCFLLPLCVLVMFFFATCGGGGNNNVIRNPGTTSGDYLLTVTATTTSGANTVTHTITLGLKVT